MLFTSLYFPKSIDQCSYEGDAHLFIQVNERASWLRMGDNFLLCQHNYLICDRHIFLWNKEGETRQLTILFLTPLEPLLRSLEM